MLFIRNLLNKVMLSGTQFYYRITRKCVVGFGTLFKDLVLVKYSNDASNTLNYTEISRIHVPVVYGGKEVYIVRDGATANGEIHPHSPGSTIPHATEMKLPILSFRLTDIQYDASRKQQSLLQQFMATGGSGVNNQYQGVPYNLKFEVNIQVRNIEDGLQIVEQILPWFTPSYTLALNLVPTMGTVKDVPITIDSIAWENDFEGEAPDKIRRVIWTLGFTMATWFYGPVYGGGLITSSIANVSFFTGAAGLGSANNPVLLDMGNTGFQLYTNNEIVYQGSSLPEANAFGYVKQFLSPGANTAYINAVNTVGSFTVGDKVQGGTSHHVGIVIWSANGTLALASPNGAFTVGETLTDLANGSVHTTANTVGYANGNSYLFLYNVKGTFTLNANVQGALTNSSWVPFAVPNAQQLVEIISTAVPANANIANGDAWRAVTTIDEFPFL